MKRTWLLLLFLLILLQQSSFCSGQARSCTPADQGANKPAASDEEQTASLAKAAQNPIASMISVPLQNNTGFGVGQYDHDQNVLNRGWYLVTSPINTADWRASSGNQWTVPLGGGVGRIMRLGSQPVNITAQLYANAVNPTGASPWGMRLQMQFLYPKKA